MTEKNISNIINHLWTQSYQIPQEDPVSLMAQELDGRVFINSESIREISPDTGKQKWQSTENIGYRTNDNYDVRFEIVSVIGDEIKGFVDNFPNGIALYSLNQKTGETSLEKDFSRDFNALNAAPENTYHKDGVIYFQFDNFEMAYSTHAKKTYFETDFSTQPETPYQQDFSNNGIPQSGIVPLDDLAFQFLNQDLNDEETAFAMMPFGEITILNYDAQKIGSLSIKEENGIDTMTRTNDRLYLCSFDTVTAFEILR